MFEARRHLYELADVTFDNSGKTVEQTVRALLAALPQNNSSEPSARKAR
jgi:hypothetical protein